MSPHARLRSLPKGVDASVAVLRQEVVHAA